MSNQPLLNPGSVNNGVPAVAGSAGNSNGMSSEARFNLLERTLEQFQENARHLGVIASDFTARSQEPLNQKVHTMISGLQELDQLKSQFADVRVPIELLDFLDQGKNPQLYTKECLQRTRQKNKEVNGKIQLYKSFRENLAKELLEEMPQDTAAYFRSRGAQLPGQGGGGGGENSS